jgi:hypothetical protein
MAIKITFRREVDVDLNRYFDALSSKTRRAIEDELFQLMSGTPKVKGAGRRPSMKDVNNGEVTVKVNHAKSPMIGSQMRAVYDELSRQVKEPLKAAEMYQKTFDIATALKMPSPKHYFSNLLAGGYIHSV